MITLSMGISIVTVLVLATHGQRMLHPVAFAIFDDHKRIIAT